GVCEFVDEHHLRLAPQHGFDVEFGEALAAVVDVLGRHRLDAFELFGGLLAPVRLDHGGDEIGATLQPAMRLAEHRIRLADAGSCAEIDAQLPTFGGRRRCAHSPIIHRTRQLLAGYFWSSSRLSCSTLTVGSPKKPSQRPSVLS